jgi:predicted nucleic acid-binding Zn ribbon protein
MTRRKSPARRAAPVPTGELLAAVLGRYGVAAEAAEERIAVEWTRLVGPRVAAHAWPDRVDDGILYVRVDSAPWLHELSFLTADLTARVNQALGPPPPLREIRLRPGGVSTRARLLDAAQARQRRPPLARRPLPEPLRGAALAAVERETDEVADPELRRAILEVRRRLGV